MVLSIQLKICGNDITHYKVNKVKGAEMINFPEVCNSVPSNILFKK